MPANIVTHQRFNAASLPSGWTFTSGMATTATNPIKGARSLCVDGQAVNTRYVAEFDTADTNSGDVLVKARVRNVSGTSTNTICEVFGRRQGTDYTSGSNYHVRWQPHSTTKGLYLGRRVTGSAVEITSGGNGTTLFADGADYDVTLGLSGTTVRCKVQRLSDGQWLKNDQSGWQAGEVWSLSVTDANVTGAGKAGISFFQATSGTAVMRADEFVFKHDITPVTVAVNDSNLYASPLNHWVNGSTAYRTVNPGSYNKLGFTGTSIALLLNAGFMTGESRVIRWRVDGGEWEDYRFGLAETQIVLASGLANTTHSLEIWYNGCDPTQTIWDATPIMGLVVLGYAIDSTKASAAPTLKTGRALCYGDSTAYGINSAGSGANTDPTQHDAQAGSPASYLMGLLDTEMAIVGFGSQGYGKAGLAGVPRVFDDTDGTADAWDLIYPGRSRLSGGLLSPMPDRIFLTFGTADYTNGGGAESTAQRMEDGLAAFLPALRTAAPDAAIYVVIPPCLTRVATDHTARRDAIIAGFDAGAGAKTLKGTSGDVTVYRGGTDLAAYLIHPGEDISANVYDTSVGASADSYDGIHYKSAFASTVADRIYAGVQVAEATSTSSTSACAFLDPISRGALGPGGGVGARALGHPDWRP